MTDYAGGCFNLKFGRDKAIVLKEVLKLLDKHDLDFLEVGEARDYTTLLYNIKGYAYYTNKYGGRGATNDGILVKNIHRVTKVKYRSVGDGWTTVDGSYHGPSQMPSLCINKELQVMGIHAVTPTHWVNGQLTGPPDRIDDYRKMVKILRRWFWWPCRNVKRMCLGDWNERPFTKGKDTPHDIAKDTKAHLTYPTNSKEGHGIIDYAMWKGLKAVHQCFKDTEIKEGSDHEPVIIVFSV